MRRLCLALMLVCLASAALGQNAAKPDFSGVWKMDPEKSNFGPVTAPASAGYVIRQTGNTVMMQYTQDGHSSRVDIVPDGDEHVTESTPDSQTFTRAYWSSAALVLESRLKPLPSSNRPPVQWTSRWSLSADRKVLTIQRRISVPDRDPIEQSVVFKREK